MDGIPFAELTPVGLLCVVLAFPYLQLARGKLIPASQVERLIAEHVRQMDDISHDRDEWRASHRVSETARQVQSEHLGELVQLARTTDSFIRALPHPSQEIPT